MKVLVVRFAAIGDCVMTAWAVTALRNANPQAEIVWAVQERCAPVIDTHQLVNQLHVFPRERWKSNRWSPAIWREQIIQYTALRKTRIDVGFDFQGHSKTALCLRLSGCRERFASRATDALAARLNPPVDLLPQGAHEVERAICLVATKFDVKLPELPIMPKFTAERKEWRARLPGDQPIVSIQTGAGETDKLYPADHWVDVADHLVSSGCRVVAIGGASDPRIATENVIDEVGAHSLGQSLALVAESDIHLSGDTGSAHAAAAYGVPTVTIFGRTDPARFRPYGNKGIVLRDGVETKNVSPRQVVESAMTLLEDKRVASPH